MPQESILFQPELDERALDRETDQVNDQLAGVGEDIPVNFDEEMPDMDGLTPAGGGGGGIGGAGAGAGAAGGLASKIPKPMAGVAAASVVPVGIAGAVGAGLLSAMHGASAMLQTDVSLMQTAVDNFFREPGNVLSEHITRPLAKDLLDVSLDFDEAFRDRDALGIGAALSDLTFQGETGMWLSAIVPGGLSIQIYNWFRDEIMGVDWGKLRTDIRNVLPSIEPIDLANFVTRVSLGGFVTGVDLARWVTGVDLTEIIEVPEILQADSGTSGHDDNLFKEREAFQDDFNTGQGGQGGGSGQLTAIQSGGRITQTGAAQVHRGELVTDEERLVSELASAVSSATGGGARRGMDTSGLRREVEGLRRDVKQLASALDVTVEIGNETVARAAARGQQDGISDSNPRV